MTLREDHIARLLRAPNTAPARFACEEELVWVATVHGRDEPRLPWAWRVASKARQAMAARNAARRQRSAAAW